MNEKKKMNEFEEMKYSYYLISIYFVSGSLLGILCLYIVLKEDKKIPVEADVFFLQEVKRA